uniref:Uncharacterized protein n=1 Tax=viral metagenome TaxID=1070528 RepID=A0A6M3LLR6_9ZZZZ
MVGNKNSGKRKSKPKQYDDWITDNPGKVAELMTMLYTEAIENNNIQAAMYVIDRVQGKPTSKVDMRQATLSLTPAEYDRYARELMDWVEPKLIESTGEDDYACEGRHKKREDNNSYTVPCKDESETEISLP